MKLVKSLILGSAAAYDRRRRCSGGRSSRQGQGGRIRECPAPCMVPVSITSRAPTPVSSWAATCASRPSSSKAFNTVYYGRGQHQRLAGKSTTGYHQLLQLAALVRTSTSILRTRDRVRCRPLPTSIRLHLDFGWGYSRQRSAPGFDRLLLRPVAAARLRPGGPEQRQLRLRSPAVRLASTTPSSSSPALLWLRPILAVRCAVDQLSGQQLQRPGRRRRYRFIHWREPVHPSTRSTSATACHGADLVGSGPGRLRYRALTSGTSSLAGRRHLGGSAAKVGDAGTLARTSSAWLRVDQTWGLFQASVRGP